MTPAPIAGFMAFLFYPYHFDRMRLLDAGAGVGTLTAAVLERCLAKEIDTASVEVFAYEIEPKLRPYLEQLLNHYKVKAATANLDLTITVVPQDFMAVYLNSTAIDTYFRRFSGHTQVNATDLRRLRYPSLECLFALGQWAMSQHEPAQSEIDQKVAAMLWPDTVT